MIAGETVNLHQGAGHPVGEVVEWIPRVGLEVVADVGRGVVAGAREAHPVKVGCSHPVLPCPCMSAVRFGLEPGAQVVAMLDFRQCALRRVGQV